MMPQIENYFHRKNLAHLGLLGLHT